MLITQSEAAAAHLVEAREGRQCLCTASRLVPFGVSRRGACRPASRRRPDMAAAQAFFRSAQAATGVTPDRVTPPRDPDRAGQRCAVPDQCLPEQQAGAGSPRHQRPLSAHAGRQMPQIGLILLVEDEMLVRMPIQFMNRSACRR